MPVRDDLYAALGPLCSNRVWPLVAPQNAARPYIVYQQVGGQPVAFLESAVVGKRNGRFQVTAWADTNRVAATTIQSAADTLVTSTTLRARPVSEPVDTFDADTGLYGTRQDFSIWFTS